MDESLSSEDIVRLVKGKTKIILYPELANYKNINDVLEPYGSAVILYLSDKNYGHWVCLIKHPDRIEFFDSYAMKPDTEFYFIKEKERKKYNYHGRPYLTELLYNSKIPIEYNHQPLQSESDDIATCGRHVAIRILFKDLLLDDYLKIIKGVRDMTPDELVLYLTENL